MYVVISTVSQMQNGQSCFHDRVSSGSRFMLVIVVVKQLKAIFEK